MNTAVTILAPIKLAKDKTEADLLAASEVFQREFVDHQSAVLRRELIRQSEGLYMDIIQFSSAQAARDVMEQEKQSSACHAFFAVMDMSAEEEFDMQLYPSLATYQI